MHKRLRLIILLCVLMAAVVAAYFIARPSTQAITSKITPQKHVSDTPSIKPTTPRGPVVDANLQSQLQNWAQNHSGNYGIAVQEVGGKQRMASYQADRSFVTASTYKLFVVYGILHDIEQGNHSLGSTTSLGLTVSQCIDAMLIRSNNDCGYPMGKLMGWNNLIALLKQQGFTNTDLYNYDVSGNPTSADKTSTAQDEADFMKQLVEGKLLTKDHTDLMLSRMKQQIYRERIPAGVPAGVEVADKPGWLTGIQCDTAVVYGTKSTYVISIMSTNTTPTQLASLSTLVYDYLNN